MAHAAGSAVGDCRRSGVVCEVALGIVTFGLEWTLKEIVVNMKALG